MLCCCVVIVKHHKSIFNICCTRNHVHRNVEPNLTKWACRVHVINNDIKDISVAPTVTDVTSHKEQITTLVRSGEKGKGMCLYSAVSSPLDSSKRFTLILHWQTCSFRHQLGFSWKHSSHAAIAQRLFAHMPTTGYSQVLIII